MTEGARGLLGSSFIKTLIPFMGEGGSTLMIRYLPKASPPNNITLGVRISLLSIGGGDTFNLQQRHLLFFHIPFVSEENKC